jgi:hypothetical protein
MNRQTGMKRQKYRQTNKYMMAERQDDRMDRAYLIKIVKKSEKKFTNIVSLFNRTAHIRHLCMKTVVLSCHRCLINTGIEKNEHHSNIDYNFDTQWPVL